MHIIHVNSLSEIHWDPKFGCSVPAYYSVIFDSIRLLKRSLVASGERPLKCKTLSSRETYNVTVTLNSKCAAVAACSRHCDGVGASGRLKLRYCFGKQLWRHGHSKRTKPSSKRNILTREGMGIQNNVARENKEEPPTVGNRLETWYTSEVVMYVQGDRVHRYLSI